MIIHVNGETRECADDATVSDLLSDLALPGTRVAVEINKQLVRRAQHADTQLAANDQVEIVTFVGGG